MRHTITRIAAIIALVAAAGCVAAHATDPVQACTAPFDTTGPLEHCKIRTGDTWPNIVRAFCDGRTTFTAQQAFALASPARDFTVYPGNIIHIDTGNCPPPAPTTTTSAPTTTTTTSTTTTAPATTTTAPAATTTTTIAANVDLGPWFTSAGLPPIEPPEGAFRLICMPSHLAYDDPVVYPGQPGAAHLHQFFGNTLTNASSTYTTLRNSGAGTCQGGPINRSGYWVPAMLNGRGQVVQPDIAIVYYKGDKATQNLPAGLRYIAGDAMGFLTDDQLYGSANAGVIGGYEFHPLWKCVTPAGAEHSFSDIIPICQPGDQLYSVVPFPYCWDGINLDSPNHRSHVVFPKRTNGLNCPADHPVKIPQFTFTTVWSVKAGDDMALWSVSSDTMPANGPPMNHPHGSTIHADWFGAWNPPTQQSWVTHCIGELRNANAANYCNGTQGRQPTPWNWTNPVHLVPIPPDPTP